MRKYGGISGIKDMLRMLSTENNRHVQLKYYCMSCGKEHRETACPYCGSKIKELVNSKTDRYNFK
jgi:DNA-directed RNA polymerase subunit RPC12/RpoP